MFIKSSRVWGRFARGYRGGEVGIVLRGILEGIGLYFLVLEVFRVLAIFNNNTTIICN